MSLQILVSFNQLKYRYSSLFRYKKHTGTKYKNVTSKESAGVAYTSPLCLESLEECLRNFDINELSELRKIDVRVLSTVAGSYKEPLRSLTDLTSSRKVSYISAESFEENKHGCPNTSNSAPKIYINLHKKNTRFNFTNNFAGLLAQSLQGNSFRYNVQLRGFKTERGIHADLKGNPNMVNRLRKSMGQYVLVYSIWCLTYLALYSHRALLFHVVWVQ